MRKVGIVCCGVIAKKLLIAKESGKLTLPIVGVTNRSEQNAKDFLSTLKNPPQYFSRQKLIQESDLIVEAASGSIVPELAKEVFKSGKDLMIISIGALIENPDIISLAQKNKCKIYAPSGAIAGLDGIKSASIGKIYSVSMITRKPLEALEGSPYLVDRQISVLKFKDEQEVIKLMNVGDIDCSDMNVFVMLPETELNQLLKSPIEQIRVQGTEYYDDVDKIELPNYIIDNFKCVKK